MIEELFHEPHQFNFFQAVRLLERETARNSVGQDSPSSGEVAAFRAYLAQAFPASDIVQLESPSSGPPEMTISFMGLTGPNGVLPQHYTTLLLERLRERDFALRDFLDLFNHRLISHFYRAWEKNHFPFAYERGQRENRVDLFTECLYCLIGRGTDGTRDRRSVDNETFLFYAGQFAQSVRSAESLQAILADYCELPVTAQEFVGHWLYLGEHNQSYLAGRERQNACNAQLGVTAVLGERVWDIQSKFRICVGPLSYAQFHPFMPSENRLSQIVELTRSFVGPEFDFDVQLVLRAEQVPQCKLGAAAMQAPRLGWNTWLQSDVGAQDATDAVFASRTI